MPQRTTWRKFPDRSGAVPWTAQPPAYQQQQQQQQQQEQQPNNRREGMPTTTTQDAQSRQSPGPAHVYFTCIRQAPPALSRQLQSQTYAQAAARTMNSSSIRPKAEAESKSSPTPQIHNNKNNSNTPSLSLSSALSTPIVRTAPAPALPNFISAESPASQQEQSKVKETNAGSGAKDDPNSSNSHSHSQHSTPKMLFIRNVVVAPRPSPRAVHDLFSTATYLQYLLDNANKTRHQNADWDSESDTDTEIIILTPLTEGQIRILRKWCISKPPDRCFKQSDVPVIMSTVVSTLLPEGMKYAGAIRKLQEMQLEWFDLRFSEYTGFSGLPDASYERRENLGRLACRKDALFVDRLWPIPGQLPSWADPTRPIPTTLDVVLDLFERSSWDTISQILDKEESDGKELASGWRYHDMDEAADHPLPTIERGPMTTLVNVLALHTLDNLPNVRSIISDYIIIRGPTHRQNQKTFAELAAEARFTDLSLRLTADLGLLDHLPHIVNKGWVPIIKREILRTVRRYFKNLVVDPHTATLKRYVPKELIDEAESENERKPSPPKEEVFWQPRNLKSKEQKYPWSKAGSKDIAKGGK